MEWTYLADPGLMSRGVCVGGGGGGAMANLWRGRNTNKLTSQVNMDFGSRLSVST